VISGEPPGAVAGMREKMHKKQHISAMQQRLHVTSAAMTQ
jgi:hypothetical protein